MEQHVLLPTDFSDNSWNATVYALKLFAEEQCTFYLFNSTSTKVSTMSNISNKLLEIMNNNAMQELLELKAQIEKINDNSNHKFEVVLSSDNLVDAIKRAVRKHKIDIVIMGTKGATGAKELLFGSNTIKVVNKLKFCPVLAIPDHCDFVIPLQIAFPTDFNRFYSNKELGPLKDMASLYNSKIRIVHINVDEKLSDIQEYNMITLGEYLKHHEFSFHWMPDYTKKAKEINVFIEDLEIDMLAMVNYKHSFIESLVKEPVIKRLGFHPIVPFLVIPDWAN